MPLRFHQYIFGRLNIIATYDDKRDFLLRPLMSDIVVVSEPFEWAFYDVVELQSPVPELSGAFVAGSLVKYRPNAEGKTVNRKEHTIDTLRIQNQVMAEAPFYLHIPTGMIAYRSVPGQIYPTAFRHRFTQLIEEEYERLLVQAEIRSIDQEAAFLEALLAFTNVKSLSIELHPSNPNNRDLWKSCDERLQKLRAAKYSESYKLQAGANPETLTKDAEIQAKVSMAEDGYGKAQAVGVGDKGERTISTAKDPVSQKVPSDVADKPAVLGTLGETFSRIAQRFRK